MTSYNFLCIEAGLFLVTNDADILTRIKISKTDTCVRSRGAYVKKYMHASASKGYERRAY